MTDSQTVFHCYGNYYVFHITETLTDAYIGLLYRDKLLFVGPAKLMQLDVKYLFSADFSFL